MERYYAIRDEEGLVVQLLSKCVLNLKNALRYEEKGEKRRIIDRMINTLQIIHELDSMLNRRVESETVDRIEALYLWLMKECERIIDGAEGGLDSTASISSMIPVIENLLEGFKERIKGRVE